MTEFLGSLMTLLWVLLAITSATGILWLLYVGWRAKKLAARAEKRKTLGGFKL